MGQPLARRPLEAIALLFAMTFPTLLAWLVFFVLPTSEHQHNRWLQLAFGAGKGIQFCFPLLYVLLFDRGALEYARPTTKGLSLSVAFGVAVALLTFVLYFLVLRGSALFEQTTERVQHWLTQFDFPSLSGFLVLAGFIAFVHSLWEEYYWRWFVFGRLRHWMSWPLAAVVSGLAFMSHHVVVLAYYLPGYFWIGAVPLALCVAVGGMVWAWLYHRTGSLYATWISHCLVDVAIMVVAYDLLNSR